MSRSSDEDYSDVLPPVDHHSTLSMPVVRPASHRRPQGWVSWWLLVPAVLAAGFGVAISVVLESGGGAAVREQARPVAPVSSQPHVVISAPTPPHTPRPVDRVRPRRPYIPVLPAPTHSRPRVKPRTSAKPSPTPSHSPHSATPAPTITVPTEAPTALGVTHTSSKETPCPA